ncbi:hypothetical protein B0H14DRAFT_3858969 [Mycena olivaceomarginata]|nr:hypothetical protein B0H14DRAFT_3858969 [Mycena olivaceomarginata]
MAIRWQREPDLEVSVWSWDKFRDLCLGDFETFAAVASVYDLVFGGTDLTVEGAGFENNEDERTYMDRMTQLDSMTAVFPNPTTSWAARFKSNVITDLDTIAREITNSAPNHAPPSERRRVHRKCGPEAGSQRSKPTPTFL